jgi:hypothetical protein
MLGAVLLIVSSQSTTTKHGRSAPITRIYQFSF